MNPMEYILSHQILAGRYSKWIVLLQEFDLKFSNPKSKKSLIFAELMIDLPRAFDESVVQDLLPDESMFLIESYNPWYGDILIYLHTQHFWPNLYKYDHRRIRHQSRNYHIIGDTLYHRGVDMVLHRCVIHYEAEKILND
jgi:hypothetical protein